jgi:CheY-like chemotaxis protein
MTPLGSDLGAVSKRRVLIVDDDEDVSWTLSEMLAKAGYETETTYSGKKALALLEQKHFDAMILDLAMPEMGGISVLHELGDAGAKIPVVVLSGYLGMFDKDKIEEIGAKAVLNKPTSYEEITGVLEKVITAGG